MTLTLQLSDKSIATIPITLPTGYPVCWKAVAATLREQAAQFDFSLEDRRDASYWEIVTPLFEEAERIASFV
jgi:hypothetical protein